MQYKDKPVPIRILKKAFEFGTRERLCLADQLLNTGIVSERLTFYCGLEACGCMPSSDRRLNNSVHPAAIRCHLWECERQRTKERIGFRLSYAVVKEMVRSNSQAAIATYKKFTPALTFLHEFFWRPS